jgi:hypothetical protein
MEELTNSQITDLLTKQTELLELLCKKKMTKTILKDIKPCITIQQFIENLELLSVYKLLNNDLPDYYVLMIIENLTKIDENNRPIICSDVKSKKFNYYSNGEWIQDDFQHKTMKLIFNKMYKMATLYIADELRKKHNEELQLCVCKLMNPDKYPYEKLIDKILIKLGQKLKSDNDCVCD